MYKELIDLANRIIEELKNFNYEFDRSSTDYARQEADACLLIAARQFAAEPNKPGNRAEFMTALQAFAPLSNLARS